MTDSGTFPSVGAASQPPAISAGIGQPAIRNGGPATGQYGVPEVVQHGGGFRASEGAPSRDRR